MKNLFVIILMFLATSPIFAAGVGYINYEKVAVNYKYAQNIMKDIEKKGQEIEAFLKSKEVEFNRLETPLQKQKFHEATQQELKAKESAFNDYRNKKEEEVYKKIYAVAEKIRLEKNLDVLIDARGVFSGGTDITDILIQRLNMTNVK